MMLSLINLFHQILPFLPGDDVLGCLTGTSEGWGVERAADKVLRGQVPLSFLSLESRVGRGSCGPALVTIMPDAALLSPPGIVRSASGLRWGCASSEQAGFW